MDRAPRLANYKLFLKRNLEVSLDKYLQKAVRTSSQTSYPDRTLFRGKEIVVDNRRKIIYPYRTKEIDDILFRARTGHTFTRDHLNRFGIIKESSCRVCSYPSETIEHLALHCQPLEEHESIRHARERYQFEVPSTIRFQDALWSHREVVSRLLSSVHHHTHYL